MEKLLGHHVSMPTCTYTNLDVTFVYFDTQATYTIVTQTVTFCK